MLCSLVTLKNPVVRLEALVVWKMNDLCSVLQTGFPRTSKPGTDRKID